MYAYMVQWYKNCKLLTVIFDIYHILNVQFVESSMTLILLSLLSLASYFMKMWKSHIPTNIIELITLETVLHLHCMTLTFRRWHWYDHNGTTY